MKPGQARLLVSVTMSGFNLPVPRLRFLKENGHSEAVSDIGAFEIRFYGEPTRATVLHELGHMILALEQASSHAAEQLLDAAARGWSK